MAGPIAWLRPPPDSTGIGDPTANRAYPQSIPGKRRKVAAIGRSNPIQIVARPACIQFAVAFFVDMLPANAAVQLGLCSLSRYLEIH